MKLKFLSALTIAASIVGCNSEVETITETIVTDEAVQALKEADFVLELLHYADVDVEETDANKDTRIVIIE